MRIVVDNQDDEQEEQEFWRGVKRWIWGWVSLILTGFLLLYAVAKLSDSETKENADSSRYWINIDPTREPYEVKHYDFSTRTVEYYEYNPVSPQVVEENPTPPRVEIGVDPEHKVILEGITPEEIIESLDIDYEDIRDYLGGELR